MADSRDMETLFEELRRLAVENPREARACFCKVLDGDAARLDDLLERVSAPGEGRLRQLIANAVRARPDKGKVVPQLLRWHQSETDEFAKRAMDAALGGVDKSAYQPSDRKSLINPELVKTYRYVADRLRHQLRNDLMLPGAHLLRLGQRVSRIADGALRTEFAALVAELGDSLQRLEYSVGIETDDLHFQMRPIAVLGWVESMNAAYGRKYQPVKLAIQSDLGRTPQVIASDFLLHSIFWNLWVNAQQAVEGECEIRLLARELSGLLELTVLDNGSGFPEHVQGIAFQDKFSSKGPTRGRGLFEVQDAVERLHGAVQLVKYRDGSLRVRITLPKGDT